MVNVLGRASTARRTGTTLGQEEGIDGIWFTEPRHARLTSRALLLRDSSKRRTSLRVCAALGHMRGLAQDTTGRMEHARMRGFGMLSRSMRWLT